MTQEAFIKILDDNKYSYKKEGNKIIVDHRGDVFLKSLTSLPGGIVFSNGGGMNLDSLTSLPEGIVFSNGGGVNLKSLTSIPKGTVFSSVGPVYLVYLIGGWFDKWDGNIEGINPKRLLNRMIELGIFDKGR